MSTHPKRRKTDLDPDSNSPAVPEFYANRMQVNLSVYELEIAAQLADSDGNLKGAVNIRLSPQLARVFAKNLAQSVNDYEKQFGKIPQPS